MQDHTDEVTAVTLQATGAYFATASLDKTWAFYDVATGTCLTQAIPLALRYAVVLLLHPCVYTGGGCPHPCLSRVVSAVLYKQSRGRLCRSGSVRRQGARERRAAGADAELRAG